MPDIGGLSSVIIPRSELPWLIDQPDSVLSTSEYHYDTLAGEYAFTSTQILKDPFHEHVIHKYLPRRLNPIVEALQEEVVHAVDDAWGLRSEWHEVEVGASLNDIIGALNHRVFVGLPLCRNKHYLANMSSFAMDIVFASTILGFIPRWFQPLVGPVIAIPNNLHYRRTAKYTKPLITERFANRVKKQQDPSFKWEEPDDYISWHMQLAESENRQDELTVDMISRRIMPIAFAALHTTLLTATNLLLDLVSADPKYLAGIREEAERVYTEDGQHWTKAGLNKLHRADSSLRESMRLNTFMSINVTRKVIAKNGITNPTEGWHAPYGAFIGADVEGVQHDPEVYPNPDDFEAFRFSQAKESQKTSNGQTEDKSETPTKNTDVINTSDTFLPFSHGRHACPGRFFVALGIKTILAYVTMNYEFERLAERPANVWHGRTVVPPMKSKIRVRRRTASS